MRRIAAATVVAMAMGSITSAVGGVALADGPTGATATGGSTLGDLNQQNTAQDGRQNSACDQVDLEGPLPAPGRLTGRCVNGDGSFNAFSRVKHRGATAAGGSGTTDLYQRNVAQQGRQNNACDLAIATTVTLIGGRTDSECADRDASRNREVLFSSGGARAEGGTGAALQQDIAQEGRQNNTCTIETGSDFSLIDSRMTDRCDNSDASHNKRVKVRGGGAEAEGGNGAVSQADVAQEGRQNNTCTTAFRFLPEVSSGREESGCANTDLSRNKNALVKGGGADVDGGNGAVSQADVAQEGRQNNACANTVFPNLPLLTNGRLDSQCAHTDLSRNKDVLVKGGGARIDGGDSEALDLTQQNFAQEGRQNNACDNVDRDSFTLTDSSVRDHCKTVDRSKNLRTREIGGGARIKGGSATGSVAQQNIAQEGRQNNACADHVNFNANVTGGRAGTDCVTVDRSVNVDTQRHDRGASVEGGSATGDLFQQNIAQDGRQNNACGNTDNFTVVGTGTTTQSQCVAVDHSVNVGTQGD
ncbi:hypothetical protein [Streptomyces shenzhenensis]|uniref:hypothetical protein n=1 Tax=Streptomyces shenzhenensis TaxID=943815 RepID=UPI0015EFFB4B|nr:hypothetical protein [Streptomyces shenzhenensis]